VFENWVLRRKFGCKRVQVVGGWRKWHDKDARNLYFSPNIIMVIKSKGMIRMGNVTRMAKMRNAVECSVGVWAVFTWLSIWTSGVTSLSFP